MGLPNAYCLKCRSYTSTKSAKTVVLTNNSRALHGVCGSCDGEVYRILEKNPDIVHFPSKAPLKLKNSKRPELPEAFCVKCRRHTPTNMKRTVVLGKGKRALHGQCSVCDSEVYRFLKPKNKQKIEKMLSVSRKSSRYLSAIYGAITVMTAVVTVLVILRIF